MPVDSNYVKNIYKSNSAANMTKEEKMLLKTTEEEYKRRGGFKRIFPSPDFLYYKQFFEEERPMNYFLDARIMVNLRQAANSYAKMTNEKIPSFLL